MEEAQGGPIASSHLVLLHENWKEVMHSELQFAENEAAHAHMQLATTGARLRTREDDLALTLHQLDVLQMEHRKLTESVQEAMPIEAYLTNPPSQESGWSEGLALVVGRGASP